MYVCARVCACVCVCVGWWVGVSDCLPACLPDWLAGWLSVCLSVRVRPRSGPTAYLHYPTNITTDALEADWDAISANLSHGANLRTPDQNFL